MCEGVLCKCVEEGVIVRENQNLCDVLGVMHAADGVFGNS